MAVYVPIVASLLVLPFVVLELVNRPGGQFPYPLFGFLWVLAFAFLALLQPWIVTRELDERRGMVRLIARLAGMAVAGGLWVALVADQWPCFIGVPNCD